MRRSLLYSKLFFGLIFTIFFFLRLNSFAQSGWVQQLPATSGYSYSMVHSGKKLFVSNNQSYTQFDEVQCKFQKNTISNNIYNFSKFFNENTGYGFSYEGKFIKTTDGGETWNVFGTTGLYPINSSSFPSMNTGYFSYAGIHKTTNGGATWFGLNGVDSLFFSSSICFINENTGFTVGNSRYTQGFIYKTTNGGINWLVTSGLQFPAILNAIDFINQNTGIIIGNSKIFKTTNTGLTWDSLSFNFPNAGLTNLKFIDNDNIVVIGNNHGVYKSSDGGLNWSVKNYGGEYPYSFIAKANDSTVYVSNKDSSSILRSFDKGETWERFGYLTNGKINKITFLNSFTGFALIDESQFNNTYNRTFLIKTTNSGNFWYPVKNDPIANRINMYSRGNDLFVMCIGGVYLKSTNFGNNWTSINTGFTDDLNLIQFVTNNVGYISTKTYKVLKTTNSGNNWFLPTDSNIVIDNDMQFYNSNTGYCTRGTWPGIYKTTNGGVNWNYQQISNSAPIYRISILDSSKILLGASGIQCIQINCHITFGAFKSFNSGNDWSLNFSNSHGTSAGFYPTIKVLKHTLNNTIYLMEESGYMYKSTDAGNNFSYEQVLSNKIYDAAVLSDSIIYIASNNGTILKTTSGGNFELTSVKQISSEIPENFNLSQNYPNPFNPVTKINFSIKISSFVTLRVYDIVGREIKILINENLSPGNYQTEFDALRLPSGIYFYKLEAKGFYETKKMLLVK